MMLVAGKIYFATLEALSRHRNKDRTKPEYQGV